MRVINRRGWPVRGFRPDTLWFGRPRLWGGGPVGGPGRLSTSAAASLCKHLAREPCFRTGSAPPGAGSRAPTLAPLAPTGGGSGGGFSRSLAAVGFTPSFVVEIVV